MKIVFNNKSSFTYVFFVANNLRKLMSCEDAKKSH